MNKERNRGQIIARGSKKWLVRVYLGRDPLTKKRNYSARTVEGTYKQAQQALTGMGHQQDTQTFVQPSKETLTEFFNRWMATRISLNKIAAKTVTDYKDIYGRHIAPAFGNLKLHQITHAGIQGVVTSLANAGKQRTAVYVHSILQAALKQAVQWDILLRNPCADIMLPERAYNPPPILTPEQSLVLLSSTAGTQQGTIYMLLLTAGIRPQECCGLQWPDFDVAERTLRIERAVEQYEPGKYRVSETKTDKSRRIIPLPQHTVDALVAHKRQQAASILVKGAAYQRNDFIFATRVGGHLTPFWIRYIWKRDLERAGLPVMKPYCARHSHLSHLLMAGVHPKVASERAGHSTTHYTMEIYTHVLPAVHRETADMVEQLIFKKAGSQ